MSRPAVFHYSQAEVHMCPRLVQYTAHTTVLAAPREQSFGGGCITSCLVVLVKGEFFLVSPCETKVSQKNKGTWILLSYTQKIQAMIVSKSPEGT